MAVVVAAAVGPAEAAYAGAGLAAIPIGRAGLDADAAHARIGCIPGGACAVRRIGAAPALQAAAIDADLSAAALSVPPTALGAAC